jgi:tRNA threonylcarbamoyladenosine biosynthesis protein TsaB
MALILNIESATTMCSVALGKDGVCFDMEEVNDGYSHAEKLAVFADELLKRNNLSPSDLDAIAVSKGPGSYTGLRIGVSLAKGLCFGADKPLIAIDTLQEMCFNSSVQEAIASMDNPMLCPMLDARRLEVYTALFDQNNDPITDVSPMILDETSFAEELQNHSIVFFGNGSEKFQSLCLAENSRFLNDIWPSASQMTLLSEKAYLEESYEDVAYFEPFYLKEFQATTPKKGLI